MKLLHRGKRLLRTKSFACCLPGLSDYMSSRAWKAFKFELEKGFRCKVSAEKVGTQLCGNVR